jgi:CubicO group peptidase (beta-lactamase class C family)
MKFIVCLTGIGVAALGAVLGHAQDINPTKPIASERESMSAAPQELPTSASHTLNAPDVNAWLDGFMRYALPTADIAGAVVVVVKDGHVLTQRGFGVSDVATQAPVDPAATLFRIGSVSKLFTWTAVMQQVEAGKLNLDEDVNRYLDFQIPARAGKPVTLRNLMTHTAGFEEHAKYLFVRNAKDLVPIGKYLKKWVPTRIFPPGEIPAYSNYGATVAGYIVERVSGEAFDAYIARHIFEPLGMRNATFDQPLPPALAPQMSKSYHVASGPDSPFELIIPAPAGSVSISGADIAQFMIAHLNNGQLGEARILKPETAREMHASAFAGVPPLQAMALGFYREDRNGHEIAGHAGDTETFHSDLHLLLNDATGLFVSFNSLGVEGKAHMVRTQLFRQFTDRYFAGPGPDKASVASAESDARLIAGTYIASRRNDTSFLRIATLLDETKIKALGNGLISVSELKAPGGALDRWHEISPFVWQRENGVERVAAVVKDGKVQMFGIDWAPFEVFQPATGAYAPWNLVVLEASLGVMLITLILWPVSALVRRHYRQPLKLVGRSRRLYKLLRLTALADVLLAVGWAVLLSLLEKDISMLNDPINIWLRLLQVIGVLAFIGGLVGLFNLWHVCTERARDWWAIVGAVILAFATVGMAWMVVALRLVTLSLQF